jgi:hypothetical protein
LKIERGKLKVRGELGVERGKLRSQNLADKFIVDKLMYEYYIFWQDRRTSLNDNRRLKTEIAQADRL